jgi:hypothetical protein
LIFGAKISHVVDEKKVMPYNDFGFFIPPHNFEVFLGEKKERNFTI